MTASNETLQPNLWWDTPSATWSDVSDATFAAWRQAQTSKITLDSDVARTAMAFGFSARAAYPDEREWANLLAPLAADWSSAGREGDYPWHYIHNAAAAGWKAAEVAPVEVAPEEDAAVEIAFVEEAPVEVAPVEVAAESHDPPAPPERNVPGGRPDHP